MTLVLCWALLCCERNSLSMQWQQHMLVRGTFSLTGKSFRNGIS